MTGFMKKTGICLIAACFLVLAVPHYASAGTVIAGAKVWIAGWNSWMGKFVEDMAPGSSADTGTGFMAGPVLGYQTDDGVWSISSALMVFSSFTQDMTLVDGPDTYNVEADLKRMDLDFALNYTVNPYFKLFAGYKYQSYKAEITVAGMDYETLELTGNMLTVGIGAVYPLSEKTIAGLQLGLIYAILGDLEEKDMFGDTYSTPLNNSIGYNAEISLNYLVSEKVILQAGLRFQTITVEFEEDSSFSYDDYFYGLTLGAMYMIQ